jgi:DNA polymerase elongation subunit (family B)
MINVEQLFEDKLKISYFDKEGDINFYYHPLSKSDYFEWERTDKETNSKYKSWDGHPVKKVQQKWLSNYRINEILSSFPDDHQIFQNNRPRIFFCDIETFVGDEWPDPGTVKTPVTLITFANGEKVFTLGTKELNGDRISKIHSEVEKYFSEKYNLKIQYKYLYFNKEYDMLQAFFYNALKKMPAITGWNFIGYDWLYLVNRAKRLGLDPSVCSPSKKLVGNRQLPLHRLVFDYLEIYKKWDRSIDIKENNTLDFVASKCTGLTKLKYHGTIQDMYERDYDKYVLYNVIDTILVQLIDKKINTMNTFLTLGNITRVEHNNAFSPIRMTENMLCIEYIKRGIVIPRQKNAHKKMNYEGAFVHEPEPGMYKWVGSFDFASLYPSIMRQWNISPDSFVKVIKPGEEYDKEKYIKAVNGSLYKREESGLKSVLTNNYIKRRLAKKAAQEIEITIKEIEKIIEEKKKSFNS